MFYMNARKKRSYLTVRNVPDDVAAQLERVRKRRGTSLNQTVVDTLRKGLGLGVGKKSNGIASLAGKWTKADFADLERTIAETFETVDEDLWR